jgi:hypothetical protein
MIALAARLLGSRPGVSVVLGLLLAAVVAAGLLYWRGESQAARIVTLASERDAAIATAHHIRRQAEASAAAIDTRRRQALARADRMERQLTEILNAPPEDDGPLAPVLGRVVGLPDDAHPAPSGRASRAAGVRAGAASHQP